MREWKPHRTQLHRPRSPRIEDAARDVDVRDCISGEKNLISGIEEPEGERPENREKNASNPIIVSRSATHRLRR